jgi:hypothetical protein
MVPVINRRLIEQYTLERAVLSALYLWNSSVAWRKWLLAQRYLPEVHDYLSRNMFDEIKPCHTCSGTSAHVFSRELSMTARLGDIEPFLSAASKKCTVFSNMNCPLERQQWQILMLLTDTYGADFDTYSNLVIRFAALSRHIGLLGLVLEKLGKTTERRSADVLNLFAMLTQAIRARNIMVIYECITTGMLHDLATEHWDVCLKCSFQSGDLNVVTLIIDAGPPPTPEFAVWALQYTGFAKWMFWDSDAQYTIMTRFIIYSLPNDLEDEVKHQIAYRACELGDVEIVRHLHERRWNVEGQNASSLLSSVLYGHRQQLKYLLNDVRVNPNLFRDGNTAIIMVALFNHLGLGYTFLTAIVAFISEVYCETQGLSGSVGLFGLMQTTSAFCYRSSYGSTLWYYSIVAVFVFGFIYLCFYRCIPLFSMIHCTLICKKRHAIQRRVSASNMVV